MKSYKYKIKALINKDKEITVDQILDKVIKEYIDLDNKLSRAVAKGNLSEDDLRELELRVLDEKSFTLHLLLNAYGYNIRKRNGINQWYKIHELVEVIEE